MPLEWKGPLAPWAAGLAEALEEHGYAERTVVRMMAVTRLSERRRGDRRLSEKGAPAAPRSRGVAADGRSPRIGSAIRALSTVKRTP